MDIAPASEITDFLKQAEIEHYTMDPSRRQVTVDYKEDFDRLFPLMGAEPMMNDPNQYGAPYGFGKIAFYDYKGWHVQGRITCNKPDEEDTPKDNP